MLDVETNNYDHGRFNDSMKAYAAGLAEGYITRDLIYLHWENTQTGSCEEPYSPYCQRLRHFLQKNLNWMKTSIKNNPGDPYWHQVSYIIYIFQLMHVLPIQD